MSQRFDFLTFVGIALVVIGIILVILPLISKYFSLGKLEQIPPILIYVYRGENFYFVTSPILILIAIVSFIWLMISR